MLTASHRYSPPLPPITGRPDESAVLLAPEASHTVPYGETLPLLKVTSYLKKYTCCSVSAVWDQFVLYIPKAVKVHVLQDMWNVCHAIHWYKTWFGKKWNNSFTVQQHSKRCKAKSKTVYQSSSSSSSLQQHKLGSFFSLNVRFLLN